MKQRFLAALLALCMIFMLVPGAAAANNEEDDPPTSGSCGANVTWSYDAATKTTTISGTGDMDHSEWGYVYWRAGTERVVVESGVTSICDGAFYKCPVLTEIDIANTVTTISENAFLNCESLTEVTLPEGVATIGRRAFGSCPNLTRVVLPGSVIRIHENAFQECENLTEFIVDSANTIYSSHDGMLFNKEKAELLCCPAGKSTCDIPSDVKSLNENAFLGCSALREVTLPGGVRRYSGKLFGRNSGVQTVKLGEGTEEISQTFSDLSELSTIYLPKSLYHIGEDTFANCYKLRTVYFAGTQEQFNLLKIDPGNQELRRAKIICLGGDDPIPPDKPDALPLRVTSGGMGRRVTATVEGGHWLTIQIRRAGSLAITSVQAPGSGPAEVSFSAPAGSTLQLWETADEIAFQNSVPANVILSAAAQQL